MANDGTKSMLAERPLLMLLDGHALVYRAWHAIREPLNIRSTGEEVRAVYGFLNSLLRALADWHPTHIILTFDTSAPTFRDEVFKEYKAQRPPMPPELAAQFDRVRQVAGVLEIPIIELDGYEADDLLGTLGRQAEEREVETLILTGDTDTLQLVSPWVRVVLSYSVQKRTVYDEAMVRERYGGLGPEHVADLKGLQGDTSDNIPGVPGVGSKTAIRLISEFGSIESLYGHLDEVTPPRIQESLRENEEVAKQARWLTTIARDAPVTLDLDAAKFGGYDRSKVVALLRDLEFFSLVRRIPGESPEEPGAEEKHSGSAGRPEVETVVVTSPESLREMTESLRSSDLFAFDTETSALSATGSDLVGISFSNAAGHGWYVPVGHEEDGQMALDRVVDGIRSLMQGESVRKVAHNANYDITVLARYGVPVTNLVTDTMVAAHLGGRQAIGLKALALDCLQEEMTPIADLIGTGRKQISMSAVPIEKAAPYAAADAEVTLRLWECLRKELEEKSLLKVFETVEMPLVPVLVQMQLAGIALDSQRLVDMSGELGTQMASIEASVYEAVGHAFNLNSSQQLGDILFKELRLPTTKRTQKGYSTDAASLDWLKQMLDKGEVDDVDPKAYGVLDQILEYRQVSKIKSTYVDALPGLVDPRTGRIHTSYNQTGSATGRVSSNDPNVQNIPVRTELGRRVRKAFVARQGDYLLLAADYSQIELRVLAHLSKDGGLVKAFANDEDIHSATAASVYGVQVDQVDADMRRIAKIMNFGVIYGLSAFGIRQQTGFSPEEGAAFIETYFGTYPGIKTYIDSVKADVKERGYVETLLGRRRYIPEIRSSNFHVRSAGERMAVNMPIQGTAADIIKIAMIRIHEHLETSGMRSKMIVQVHDELIFEVPTDEMEQMSEVASTLMPGAMELVVPLKVDLKKGLTWGDME